MSGEFTEVRLADWSATAEVFRAFDATVTVEDDQITLERGDARLVVGRDGRLRGAMPLHEFERGDVERLELAPEAGTVRVTDGADSYEFRLP